MDYGKARSVPACSSKDAKLARLLIGEATKSGVLSYSQLDQFLDGKKNYLHRLELFVQLSGDLPLADVELAPVLLNDRPRLSPLLPDDNLRRYLRQVGERKRMDKAEEVRFARRIEFARRRFEFSVRAAQLSNVLLRQVLGVEYSRTYARDLALCKDDSRVLHLAESRRQKIRTRAAELNRLRSIFVERNLGLAVDIAMAYRTYGVPLMDLIQEGNGALIRAVEKFDWRKDVRFQTYATFWIRQAVERSIAFNKGIVRVPNYLQQKMRRLRREGILPRRDRDVSINEVSVVFDVKPEVANHLLQTERTHFSLDMTIDEDGETFASVLPDNTESHESSKIEFTLLCTRLSEVLNNLSELEREILELRYGLNGSSPLTLEEVGRKMNVSRERIRQLQVRAIRKLQRPSLIQRLAGFV